MVAPLWTLTILRRRYHARARRATATGRAFR